jgi:hypothetical protein
MVSLRREIQGSNPVIVFAPILLFSSSHALCCDAGAVIASEAYIRYQESKAIKLIYININHSFSLSLSSSLKPVKITLESPLKS